MENFKQKEAASHEDAERQITEAREAARAATQAAEEAHDGLFDGKTSEDELIRAYAAEARAHRALAELLDKQAVEKR